MKQTLYIKGMVCDRCIASVRGVFEELGLQITDASLGELSFEAREDIDLSVIERRLNQLGFSLLKDKKRKLISDTKDLIASVYSGNFDFPNSFRFSKYAREKLGSSYDTISATFTESEQTTIEKYILHYRTERLKEALVYTDQSLADLAFSYGFSSVSHLSKQFKLITGLTPSHFREIRAEKKLLRSEN